MQTDNTKLIYENRKKTDKVKTDNFLQHYKPDNKQTDKNLIRIT